MPQRVTYPSPQGERVGTLLDTVELAGVPHAVLRVSNRNPQERRVYVPMTELEKGESDAHAQ